MSTPPESDTSRHPAPLLTLEEASDLVGDDIAYWLRNPFMDPASIEAKVCWWIARAATGGVEA